MAATANSEVSIDFCTLGMFIIDDIEFAPGQPPSKDILGGAGSYSAIGARLLSPPPLSGSVGWIVDAGSDFPPGLRSLIASWDTSCLVRETPERLTTRGWNGYGENEHRAFKYVTPKLRLDQDSLTPALLASKSFHLICSPKRCIDLVESIMTKRMALAVPPRERPIFIWEPVPDLCVESELENCHQALRHVDVVSPNHGELCSFFGRQGNTASGEVDTQAVEKCSRAWLAAGVGADGKGAVVVRAGKSGCFVQNTEGKQWLPAYHQASNKVIDPTGGGNAFLGGFAVGLIRGTEANGLMETTEAAQWGSVAASFAIEQVGMPTLNPEPGEQEKWNGVNVFDRLKELKGRSRT